MNVMRTAFAKVISPPSVEEAASSEDAGPVQEEARKRFQGYRTELEKRADVVTALIGSGKLLEAAKEINALSKAVRYVGNAGKEFMILGNKLTSFVEEKAADGVPITNTNLVRIHSSFTDLVEKTESGIQTAERASVIEDEIDPSRQLQRFEATKTQLLKTLMEEGYVVAKAPVIIVTTPFLRADLVKQYFNAETFQGYVILKNQVVIGVSPDFIKAYTSKKVTKKDKKHGIGYSDQALNHVLDVLREKQKSARYVIAGAPHERFRTAWLWVMPDKDLNLLRTCTSSGSLRIDKWDLSFSGV